jgi:hypothetical protein
MTRWLLFLLVMLFWLTGFVCMVSNYDPVTPVFGEQFGPLMQVVWVAVLPLAYTQFVPLPSFTKAPR